MSKTNSLTDSAPETLRIEKLVYGGAGLGRHDSHVYLVPKVAAGELVAIEPRREKSNFTEASLSEVIEPAAERVPAACPHYERCGGCHYQHLPYEQQLHWKREILRELFERARLALDVEIETIAAAPLGYRNRTQFHFHNSRVGFLEAASHRLVPATACPVSSPKISEVLTALNRLARDRRFPNFLKSLEVFTNETDIQLNVVETNSPVAQRFFDWLEREIPGVKPGAIRYSALGREWKVSYRSFFQVNRFLIDALAESTLAGLSGGHALDLYAGVGLFSLPLAGRFERVTAVESGKVAMYDLEANAKAQAVGNVRIAQANVDAFLTDLGETPEVILADPPRSGLGKVAAVQLGRIASPELRLVSCDPATLVRDLALLLPAGYRIAGLTLIDLFPQTFHIETITRLVRD
ncbi:MAG: class I SAM-dependent RNA methyltransferase [Acidobacteriota bacterium]|jgi:23S rRNA (uracil1939-C5)-methyltransferase